MKWARNNVREEYCEHCNHDGSISRLEISHKISHDGCDDLAFDVENLQTLCSICHHLKGMSTGDFVSSKKGRKLS